MRAAMKVNTDMTLTDPHVINSSATNSFFSSTSSDDLNNENLNKQVEGKLDENNSNFLSFTLDSGAIVETMNSLFDYDDEEILKLNNEQVSKMFNYLHNYMPPATLSEHQQIHADRIPPLANILLFGKTGHGKSSFINTVEKCLGSKLWPRAKLGSRSRPGTEELVMYDVTSNINMIDTRGAVSFSTAENEELFQILSNIRPLGHLERDADKTSSLIEKYKKRVKPHQLEAPLIHSAVLVVSKDVNDEELVGIGNFIESLSAMKLKVVAILTKIDEMQAKDVEKIVQRLHSIGVSKVCPIINYPCGDEKREKDPRTPRQVLVALKTILTNFEAYTYQYSVEPNNTTAGSLVSMLHWGNAYIFALIGLLMIAIYTFVALTSCLFLQD